MLAPKSLETLIELWSRRHQALEKDPGRSDAVRAGGPVIFASCLRTAPAGSAPEPGGCTNDMLKVCLDDAEILQLLGLTADFARGAVRKNAMHCFTLTALQKKEDCWPNPSRSSSASMSKPHVRHSSLHCPRGREWTVWVMQSETSQKWTRTPLFSRSMGSEPTFTCSEFPF